MHCFSKTRSAIPLLLSFCVLNPHPIVCGVASALKFGTVNNNNPPQMNNINVPNTKHEDSTFDPEFADESTWPQDVAMKYPSFHKFLTFHDASNTGGVRTNHPGRPQLLHHYLLSKPHSYPVAGKFQKMDSKVLFANALTGTADNDEMENWMTSQFGGNDRISSPNQNPHIGTSSFANLPKFWNRVRQNLRGLHDTDQDVGDGDRDGTV
ncbi:unnamed protein product [Orchesella dallaii]|uniref:Uncharacterized protein n=1 Tax=Orchesella dallaii TaxID=48710 RepID=A0ABP1S051_9HEXA